MGGGGVSWGLSRRAALTVSTGFRTPRHICGQTITLCIFVPYTRKSSPQFFPIPNLVAEAPGKSVAKGLHHDSDNYRTARLFVANPKAVTQMKSPIHNSRSGNDAMIFVEGSRLLFVLAGSVIGYELGRDIDASPHAPVVGLLFGAAISYVLGGIAGRLIDRGLQHAVFLFRNTPPGEVFAASIISTTGMLLGLVIGLPLLVLFRSGYALLITALLSWVLASLGWRLGSVKGRQIVEAAGLSSILAPQTSPPQGHALLADGSAVMDRFLLVLGRVGLLPGGLVIPQFVVDHVRSVAESPDPVSSRRARRGLESLEALRAMGVEVHVGPDEVPEVDDATIKLLTVARRTGLRVATCSSNVVDVADKWELPVVDLRKVTNDLSPDHVPGEHLFVDLIKEGRQPRQAVGYLPDGDMVVVNDASHLIDQGTVAIAVLSSRPTSQGVMVFAKLAAEAVTPDGAPSGRSWAGQRQGPVLF